MIAGFRSLILPALGCSMLAAQPAVSFVRQPGKIQVLIGGQEFSNLYYGSDWSQPFLHPLRAADGVTITRGYPVEKIAGESQDHIWHHGLWYAHGDINGVDFWRDKGPESTGCIVVVGEPATSRDTVSANFRLVAPGGKVLGLIEQSFRFLPRGANRIVDVTITVRAPQDAPLKFGDTEEGALGIRFRDEFREDRGAAITNSSGLSGNSQVWGKRAAWVDYTTTVDGRKVGAAIFDHAANPKYPTFWHARGYGLCAANPFGERDFTKDKSRDGSLTVPAGQAVVFRYCVAIHQGALDADAIARFASDFGPGR